MKKHRIEDFTRGWVIGDFEPSLYKTKDFEVSISFVEKGYVGARHIHKLADEIHIVTSGKFKLDEDVFVVGDIVYISAGEFSGFECLESGSTTTIKTSSVKGDKYLVE